MTPEPGPQPLWQGRAQRADKLLLAGLLIAGAYGLVLLPLTPSLVGTHPVLLELLRGSIASIVTMGGLARTGHASVVVAVLASVPSYLMFDWLYWWAGRRWGEPALTNFLGRPQQAERRLRRLERIMHSIGPFAVPLAPFLPIPSPVVYVMVGLGGMRLWVFLVLDLIGSLLWGGVLVALGWALGQRAVDVAHAISHYALLSTVAIVVAIVAWQVWSARRDPRPPART